MPFLTSLVLIVAVQLLILALGQPNFQIRIAYAAVATFVSEISLLLNSVACPFYPIPPAF